MTRAANIHLHNERERLENQIYDLKNRFLPDMQAIAAARKQLLAVENEIARKWCDHDT
jgi:uncharacterized protein involved in exopolysaccharide biosynthesis